MTIFDEKEINNDIFSQNIVCYQKIKGSISSTEW